MNETTLGITGSSGALGTALKRAAQARGYRVVSFRHQPKGLKADERVLNLSASPSVFEGIDILVHLAGKNLFTLWTPEAKREFWTSRVDLSAHVAKLLAQCETPPRQVISASGISYYGDGGSKELVESSPSGTGFLADLTVAWEHALQGNTPSPWRLHHLRTSMILGPDMPSVQALRRIYRCHAGQRLGKPETWTSWLHVEDYVRLVFHLIETASPSGPVNVSAPQAVTQAQFHEALQARWGKTWLPQIPNTSLLKLGLGEASDLFLNSLRVVPQKLLSEGFEFKYRTLKEALKHV